MAEIILANNSMEVFAQLEPVLIQYQSLNYGLNQSLPEDFKKVVKNQISKIFSDMLSQVDER